MSATTGTVLICYDPSQQTSNGILDDMRRAHRSHNRWDDTFEAREVETVTAAREFLAGVDLRLRQLTASRVTLRHLALTLFSYRALVRAGAAGWLSLEAVESAFEVGLAWIVFRHPRLERELARMEEYVAPPI